MIRRAVEGDGFVVCAEASDAPGAIREAAATQPDVALLDVRMPGSGVRAADSIRARHPGVQIVMLSVSDDDDDLFAALTAGASGYVLKGQDPSTVPQALRNALRGESVLSGLLLTRLIAEFRARDGRSRIRARVPAEARLTAREWQVLELLAAGHETADIAKALFVARVTVRSHIHSVIRKLHVSDRHDLIRLIHGEIE
jgi:DNA-binding NarL/FixJ family response regulator